MCDFSTFWPLYFWVWNNQSIHWLVNLQKINQHLLIMNSFHAEYSQEYLLLLVVLFDSKLKNVGFWTGWRKESILRCLLDHIDYFLTFTDQTINRLIKKTISRLLDSVKVLNSCRSKPRLVSRGCSYSNCILVFIDISFLTVNQLPNIHPCTSGISHPWKVRYTSTT